MRLAKWIVVTLIIDNSCFIDPRGQVEINIVIHVVGSSVCLKLPIQMKKITAGRNCRLTKWIIDDSCPYVIRHCVINVSHLTIFQFVDAHQHVRLAECIIYDFSYCFTRYSSHKRFLSFSSLMPINMSDSTTSPGPQMANPVPIHLYHLDTFPASADEVLNLCHSILRLQPHFEDDSEVAHANRPFLSALAVLATDFLTSGIGLLNPHHYLVLFDAAKVLCRFILSGLRQTQTSQAPAFITRDFLASLGAMCSGNPSLEKQEQTTLVNLLKEWNCPAFICLDSAFPPAPNEASVDSTIVSPNVLRKSSGNQVDLNRPQTDLTPKVLEQLRTPIDKDTYLNELLGPTDNSADVGGRTRAFRVTFANKNIQQLQSLDAGDVLIDLCSNCPLLSNYISHWNDISSGEGVSNFL